MANGIDTSIYRTLQAPDLVGAVDQGMRMSDMIKTRRKADAKDQAYKAGVVTNPDGTTTVDRAKTASALAGAGLVEESEAFDRQTTADKQAKLAAESQQWELIGQAAGNAKDQASYDQSLSFLEQRGVDISKLPKQFDPSHVAHFGNLSAKFMAQKNADRDYALREAESKRKAVGDPFAQVLKAERVDKMKRERDEAEFKKTPDGRLQNLNSGDKQRYDNVRMGFGAIGNMSQALGKGDNTFSIVGDNDFTIASSAFEEALGRMQSGGAIGQEELKKYLKMRPTAMDPKDMQLKKLAWLEEEFGQRFKTLGFEPTDAGLAYQTKKPTQTPQGQSIGGLDAANAAAPKVLKTNQIEWAD